MTVADDVRGFSWLLSSFVEQTAGVTDAVAVSSDGLLMAMSSQLERASAEQVAAIISGLVSLGHGASQCFSFDGFEQMIVAMRRGLLLVSAISDGSCIGVVARKGCDIGLVGYQMTLLVERAGAVLTPSLVTELKHEMLAAR
jgi:predicted regulator of Ras-like GTPase activity (Roadblock/LC7/MglB family)